MPVALQNAPRASGPAIRRKRDCGRAASRRTGSGSRVCHMNAPRLSAGRASRAGASARNTRHAYRRPEPVAREILLETRVTGLVYGAHQALREIVLAVAGGQAHIFRDAAAEGVHALVEPPGIEIEAEQLHYG